ncbi:phycobilisome linker polypeptide [Chamaesiphon minutus]|nr:phycobilisome linker polypeptide [Chamaesiphon minutus]
MVKIDVTNMSSHSPIRSGSYSMKVPFASLSRTMQFIHRSGGKVVEVTKLSATTTLTELPHLATPVYTSTVNSKPQSPAATVDRTEPQSTQDRSKRGGKHHKK